MIWLVQNGHYNSATAEFDIPTRDNIAAKYPYGPFPTSAFPNASLPTPPLNWPDVHGDYASLYTEWTYDGLNASNGKADAGDYWAQTGDEFFVRIVHSKRNQYTCTEKYLGIKTEDLAACGRDDFVDASIVSHTSYDDQQAPIVSVKLYQAVEFES